MALSNFRQGLGRLPEVLQQGLFPVPTEVSQNVDPETLDALRKQAWMQLGLGMLAARDRGAGLGSGVAFAMNNAQQGVNRGLGQAYLARRDQRQEERQSTYDERLARAEERGIAERADDVAFRERGFTADESQRGFERQHKEAQLRLAGLERGPTGTWSQPFEAIDPNTDKPSMFQSHSITGDIRPATVGAQPIGPKPDRSSDSIAPESLIWRQSVAYFGGIIDPETGKITGLDQTQTARTQELAAQASRLFRDGGGRVTAAEAVQQAISGRPQPTGGLPEAAGGLPPAAVASLKGGVVTTFRNGQRWTLKNGQPVQVK